MLPVVLDFYKDISVKHTHTHTHTHEQTQTWKLYFANFLVSKNKLKSMMEFSCPDMTTDQTHMEQEVKSLQQKCSCVDQILLNHLPCLQ